MEWKIQLQRSKLCFQTVLAGSSFEIKLRGRACLKCILLLYKHKCTQMVYIFSMKSYLEICSIHFFIPMLLGPFFPCIITWTFCCHLKTKNKNHINQTMLTIYTDLLIQSSCHHVHGIYQFSVEDGLKLPITTFFVSRS